MEAARIPTERNARRRHEPRVSGAPSRELIDTLRRINAELEANSAGFAVPIPADLARDRESVSTALLAAVARGGGRPAFDLLFRMNEPFVRLLCQVRLRKNPRLVEADDLVHDTFVTLYRRAHTFVLDARATFTGWVTRMVENLIIGHARRAKNRPISSDLRDIEDGARDPLGRMILDEARERVTAHWPLLVRFCAAALLRLPPQMRRVVELRECEGLSYREIADRLSVSRGTAAMLLHRARLKILEVMNRSLAHPGRDPRHGRGRRDGLGGRGWR